MCPRLPRMSQGRSCRSSARSSPTVSSIMRGSTRTCRSQSVFGLFPSLRDRGPFMRGTPARAPRRTAGPPRPHRCERTRPARATAGCPRDRTSPRPPASGTPSRCRSDFRRAATRAECSGRGEEPRPSGVSQGTSRSREPAPRTRSAPRSSGDLRVGPVGSRCGRPAPPWLRRGSRCGDAGAQHGRRRPGPPEEGMGARREEPLETDEVVRERFNGSCGPSGAGAWPA